MKIERTWAMPNKWTFTIKPIAELLREEVKDGRWIDPFAGENSPAHFGDRNDLDESKNTAYHEDAFKFLQRYATHSVEGILFDPPYSITQAAQCYKSHGKEKLHRSVSNMGYWKDVKNEMARILKPGGKVICFGWNSMGLGKNRGFEMERILMVAHGGSKNDTIVTVEFKRILTK